MNATTVRSATPRNTHRQCRYSATAPARNGPIERGDHPRRRERGEDAPVDRRRIDAGDDDVERDGLAAGAQSLDQAPDDEDLHRRREPGHDETDHEEHHRRRERREHSAAVAPRADRHHPDDARGERAGERDRVQRRAVEIGAHDRHHRRHRERLHRREEDQRDRADRDPDVLRTPDAAAAPDRRGRERRVVDRAGHGPTSAPMRSTASRSTSGEQPKLMRTWPLPSSPKSGPNSSATFASRRILRRGVVAPAEAERSTHARNPASGMRYPAPGRCSASRSASSRRLSSSAASSASSHASLSSENAATAASAPNSPVRHSTSAGRALHDARRSLPRRHHQRALETGEVERLARARDGVADARRRRRGIQERGEHDARLHERAWISSLITVAPKRAARSARAASVSRECTVPVGLCGLHSSIARAPPAKAASMPARSSSQPASLSSSGTRSTTAPASGMHS